MIRAFFKSYFPKILDILFILSVIGVFLGSCLPLLSISYIGFFKAIFTFLISFIGGLLFLSLSFGVIYLLIDIRDALVKKQ